MRLNVPMGWQMAACKGRLKASGPFPPIVVCNWDLVLWLEEPFRQARKMAPVASWIEEFCKAC